MEAFNSIFKITSIRWFSVNISGVVTFIIMNNIAENKNSASFTCYGKEHDDICSLEAEMKAF